MCSSKGCSKIQKNIDWKLLKLSDFNSMVPFIIYVIGIISNKASLIDD